MSGRSLRDMYTAPSASWDFIPTSGDAADTANAVAGSSRSTQVWSARPSPNSIFDLAPSLDLSEPSAVDVTLLLKTLAASAVLQMTSTAIVMPWQVAKVLLQVQWVPRDINEQPETTPTEEEEEVMSDSSSNDDSYFADPNNAGSSRAKYTAPRQTDEQGYVVRGSVLEEDTRPDHIIPVGSADGVWGMLKRVSRFPGEGPLALWKGLLTSFIHDVLNATVQPFVQSVLMSIFLPSWSPYQQPPLAVPIASHVLTGLFLSPLDLIRTRLIVQAFHPRHRHYAGPLDAFSQIVHHEGGFKAMYTHPHLFLPALLDVTLRPLVSLALPGILANYMGGPQVAQDTHPLGWAVAELGAGCLGLLATLPVETVRRRLQVQVRGTAKPLRGAVELRPVPYNGFVDTIWHILTEERSDLPIARRKQRRRSSAVKGKMPAHTRSADLGDEAEEAEEGFFRNTGLGQLYRGFGMQLGASFMVLLLQLSVGRTESDSGWAEL